MDSHNRGSVGAGAWSSQIAFSQDRRCPVAELTASLSASAGLVAGSENLFSVTKLITVGSPSPGAFPDPYQHMLSCAFPLPLVPLASLSLFPSLLLPLLPPSF